MSASVDARRDPRPLIAHVVYRFDVGGLENGVVNLINRMPGHAYRHAVVSLTEITDFRKRIQRDDVQFVALHKQPGHALPLYPRLLHLLRNLRPAIVHTRNLAALEVTVPAWLAGVKARVHGEHGRDVGDLDGSNRRYRWVRRLYRPFVSRYVTVSRDLENYLRECVGVPQRRILRICNGVNTERFAPADGERTPIEGCPFQDPDLWLVGSVGRLYHVKDQVTLAHAFVAAVRRHPSAQRLRLVLVGNGPLRVGAERVLRDAGLLDRAWLPGERSDVPEILRGLDCFVLPSLAEGISNTLLEAMSTGLPIVATRVGGNPELVDDQQTGRLVPAAEPESMADAILSYYAAPEIAHQHGKAARAAAVQRFSLDRMVSNYVSLYDELLSGGNAAPARAGASDRTV
jgi:sugar transferase (PEP-CTERM/EpsH1 system associated)